MRKPTSVATNATAQSENAALSKESANFDWFRLNALKRELEELLPSHRIAFAASICERLLPNYNIFAEEEA